MKNRCRKKALRPNHKPQQVDLQVTKNNNRIPPGVLTTRNCSTRFLHSIRDYINLIMQMHFTTRQKLCQGSLSMTLRNNKPQEMTQQRGVPTQMSRKYSRVPVQTEKYENPTS